MQTKPKNKEVDDFIATVDDKQKRDDSSKIVQLMAGVTGEQPVMWGPKIIGFGHRHYKYESGREGDTMVVGFSPRKSAITLYGLGLVGNELLEKLGPHSTGKGCLYIKRLSDVDESVLRRMVERAYKGATK